MPARIRMRPQPGANGGVLRVVVSRRRGAQLANDEARDPELATGELQRSSGKACRSWSRALYYSAICVFATDRSRRQMTATARDRGRLTLWQL